MFWFIVDLKLMFVVAPLSVVIVLLTPPFALSATLRVVVPLVVLIELERVEVPEKLISVFPPEVLRFPLRVRFVPFSRSKANACEL